MTTDIVSKTECRIPRFVGYTALVIAGTVVGSTLFGWAVIALTTVLRD
jgi:hypothetical protein